MEKALAAFFCLLLFCGCDQKEKSKAFDVFNEGVTFSLQAIEAQEKGNFEGSVRLNTMAIEKFHEALKVDSNHAMVRGVLGHNYYLIRNYKDAIYWFEQAIAHDSAFAPTYREYGLSKINLGDINGGREAINKAFELDSSRTIREITTQDLYDIGTLAFDYGKGYEAEGDKEKGTVYRKFALNVLLTAHQIDSTNIAINRSITDFTQQIKNL